MSGIYEVAIRIRAKDTFLVKAKDWNDAEGEAEKEIRDMLKDTGLTYEFDIDVFREVM